MVQRRPGTSGSHDADEGPPRTNAARSETIILEYTTVKMVLIELEFIFSSRVLPESVQRQISCTAADETGMVSIETLYPERGPILCHVFLSTCAVPEAGADPKQAFSRSCVLLQGFKRSSVSLMLVRSSRKRLRAVKGGY